MPVRSEQAFRVTVECENAYPSGRYHWMRKLEIPVSYSLLQAHYLMTDLLGFDDELFEFYGSRNGWTRNLVFFEHGTYEEYIAGYQSLRLSDVYPLPRLRLYYRLDLRYKWIFAFKNPRRVACTSDIPLLIDESGENPRQYPGMDF